MQIPHAQKNPTYVAKVVRERPTNQASHLMTGAYIGAISRGDMAAIEYLEGLVHDTEEGRMDDGGGEVMLDDDDDDDDDE